MWQWRAVSPRSNTAKFPSLAGWRSAVRVIGASVFRGRPRRFRVGRMGFAVACGLWWIATGTPLSKMRISSARTSKTDCRVVSGTLWRLTQTVSSYRHARGRRSRRNIAYRAHSARLAKDTFSSAKASLTTRRVWHAPRIVMVSSRWRACAERRRSPPERRYKSEELFADPDGQRSAHRSAVSSRTPSRAARWCA